MPQPLRCVDPKSLIAGWDFSTGSVKCVIFDVGGRVVEQIQLPTDLWFGQPDEHGCVPPGGLVELNVMQLEGQARASVRAIASRLKARGRLTDWVAGGISGTHHTAARIDKNRVQVRRAICWNDGTLAKYRKRGERRLGGAAKVRQLIHGPWADRYSLSHLVKDEEQLSAEDWQRTYRILSHGPLAAGYLTGNFDQISVSAAASTGIMDFKSAKWCKGMLGALKAEEYQRLAWKQLPEIVDHFQPLGQLAPHVALEAGIDAAAAPWVFPTSDDQQAGLVGGGAVEDGQMAIILGNSAVVNTSSRQLLSPKNLDVMRLNWGPYLIMRCYGNGAQFVDQVVRSQSGAKPNWADLEKKARAAGPGAGGTQVLPFANAEPSLGIDESRKGIRWFGERTTSIGRRYRAALESIAYLIALGVEAHEAAGQTISSITVSGGMARSDLMCEILATVLDRPIQRLESEEGPALGAAVTALAALESALRTREGNSSPYSVSDAVAQMVRFGEAVPPRAAWKSFYIEGQRQFRQRVGQIAS